MRNITIIALLLLTNLISSQEKFNNEKEIEKIENYFTEEITARVNDEITLFGTLTTPKSDFEKILIIISGTGKVSQKAHNYLTEFLLKNNIGVFRFDKRGVGKSTGRYNDWPSSYTNDFVLIYNELKKSKTVSKKKIGFLGHSRGGVVTVLAIEKNIKPDFLIQWSAPIGKLRDALKYQIENGIKDYDKLIIGETTKKRLMTLDYIYKLIDENPNKTAWELWKIGKKESKNYGINKKSYSKYLMPGQLEEARIDNTKAYQDIDFPTLVIIGKEDVLVNPKQSRTELNKIGNPNIEFKEIEKLNHFMTIKGTNQRTNEIYDIDLYFKEYLVNWIKEL